MNKYSPLKNRPLRNPGQSLDEKIQDILYDDVYPYIITGIFLVFIAGMEWSRQIFNTPPNPLLWTFIALVAVGYYAVRIKEALKHIKNIRLGRDGEKIVGQSLEQLRESGYKVFHDLVDIDGVFNIDHIIIGSTGVFTVETKTRSKAGGVRKVEYNGSTIKIDGLVPDRNPIFQAKAQARWLEYFIFESTGIKINVKPVVVYPGWFVESRQAGTDVWVLNEKAFLSFLQKEEDTLNGEQVNLISAQIKKYIQETSR